MNYTAKEIVENTRDKSSLWRDEYQEYFNHLLDWPGNDYVYNLTKFGEAINTSDDQLFEIADSVTTVYTSEQLAWYQEDVRRVIYMEDFINNYGGEDIYQILSGGIYAYHIEKLSEVLWTLKEFYENWEMDEAYEVAEEEEEDIK